MRRNVKNYDQIARTSAAAPRIALIRNGYALSVIDSGGNRNCNFFAFFLQTGTAASLAGVVDNRSLALTGRACLRYAEKSRAAPNLPRTAAGRAGFALSTVGTACSAAFGTDFVMLKGYFGLCTVYGVFKRCKTFNRIYASVELYTGIFTFL